MLLKQCETGKILLTIPLKKAVIIPQKATFDVLDKKFVYVIGNNVVKSTQVIIAQEMPHLYIVASGLSAKDKILAEGLGKVKNNEKIESKFVPFEKILSDLNNLHAEKVRTKKIIKMFTKFIQRPVLTITISIGMVFLGLLAITSLPVAQFPDIAPPRVSIFIEFPGSNADVLVKSTLTILEREINGVQGMQYMLSDATSASEARIIIYKLL